MALVDAFDLRVEGKDVALVFQDNADNVWRFATDGANGQFLLTKNGTTHFDFSSTDFDLKDSVKARFGDSADVTMAWDGTDFDILPAADDSVLKFGNGTLSFDIWTYGASASDNIIFDASANTMTFNGVDLHMDDADILAFGDDQDATIVFDGTQLVITPAAAGGVVHVGDASDTAANVLHIFDGSTEKPAMIALYDHAGVVHYLWVDNTGDLRVHTSVPSDEDSDGTIVGTQA